MYFTEMLIDSMPGEILTKIFDQITLSDALIQCNFHAVKYLMDTKYQAGVSYQQHYELKDRQFELLEIAIFSRGKENDIINMIDFLINQFNFSMFNSMNDSILYTALQKQDPYILKTLLHKFKLIKYVDRRDSFNSTLGHYLVSQSLVESGFTCLKLLIKAGCNVNAVDDEKESILFMLLRNYTVSNDAFIYEMLKFAINRGVDVNQKNIYEETPFMLASRLNHVGYCKLLHKHGADINIRDRKDNFPYMYIKPKTKNNAGFSKYILTLYDSYEQNIYGDTLFHVLSESNCFLIEVGHLLVNYNKALAVKNRFANTCLHNIIFNKTYQLFDIIFEYLDNNPTHPVLSERKSDGSTPFLYAISMNEEFIAERLLNSNSINHRNYTYMNALHLAVLYSSVYIVKILVESGVNKNAIDDNGFTPLGMAYYYTAIEDQQEKIDYLLKENCVQ